MQIKYINNQSHPEIKSILNYIRNKLKNMNKLLKLIKKLKIISAKYLLQAFLINLLKNLKEFPYKTININKNKK